MQFQGAVVLVLLGLGWLLAGIARRKELRRQEKKRVAFDIPQGTKQVSNTNHIFS